ncbi:MAG: hypothetical protein IIT46_07430 [Lachnospiraceae bacterium]|nr:hypothetical protein [Lachnospiraceae bacterium]
MEMTIKQLANELKVGKTTINRVIAQLDLQDKLHKTGNRYMLSETQIEQIKLKISHQSNHETEPIKQKSNQTNHETEPNTPKTNQSNHENEPKPHQSNQTHQTNQDLQLSILDRQLTVKDNQIQILQDQLISKDNQIAEKDRQIKLLQEQITQLTNAMENLTTALTAEQALHAGTIQKQLAEHSAMEESESEQPKKQGFLSRFFSKKEK